MREVDEVTVLAQFSDTMLRMGGRVRDTFFTHSNFYTEMLIFLWLVQKASDAVVIFATDILYSKFDILLD